ncbi:MAG: redoxin domain-containing protein [Chloroflexi bacterium]|nr:redoxin domain-containing protein [Chloroflexota bacterium]
MTTEIFDKKTASVWQKKYDKNAPRVGDIAPDFSLRDVNGQNPVKLSDFRQKKPVALVFGSFT